LEPETIEHLFCCHHTQSMLPDILNLASATILGKKSNSNTYKAISSFPFPVPTDQLMCALVTLTPNFLQSPLSKGIVDHSSVSSFAACLGLPFPLPQAHLWLTLALDGWLTSFYQLVWKARNDLIFR
jgi:hypothetical protein